jgi:thioredoxin-dependent peroxiredoxin
MFDWLFSNPLEPGTPAPDFALPDQDGRVVALRSLRGRNVILVFYPGDDTPFCAKQLCAFRDHRTYVEARNTLIYGINPQGERSHAKFREKFRLPFPLLIDKKQAVGALYRTRGLMVKRTVYLIGPDGVIRFAKRGAPDPDDVLAAAA